jgi:hypothetical protein
LATSKKLNSERRGKWPHPQKSFDRLCFFIGCPRLLLGPGHDWPVTVRQSGLLFIFAPNWDPFCRLVTQVMGECVFVESLANLCSEVLV